MKLKTNEKFPDLPLTCKVLVDGTAFYNINGLYKVCKKKKDAEFIYKLVKKNYLEPGAPKLYILLDGYEIVYKTKKSSQFDHTKKFQKDSLVTAISKKFFKDTNESEISLKLSGMFLYRIDKNGNPFLLPCEESRINNKKVDFYHQYVTEFYLPKDYLIKGSFDESLLPQSTQLFALANSQDGYNENYFYILRDDLKNTINHHFMSSSPNDFNEINPDRNFSDGRELNIDTKKTRTTLSNKPISFIENETLKASNDTQFESDAEFTESTSISHPKSKSIGKKISSGVSFPVKKRFKSTVESFMDFIISFQFKNLTNKEEIYQHLFKKYPDLYSFKTASEALDSEKIKDQHLENVDIELFVTALLLVIQNDLNIRRYKVADRIFDDYLKFKRNNAWAKSRIALFINRSTKELSKYQK